MEYRIYKEKDNIITDEYLKDEEPAWRIIRTDVLSESFLERMPGYDQVLVVIKGDVVLCHEGHRVARLKDSEQDRFDGAYKTKCFGKMSSYILSVKKGYQGLLDHITAEEQNKAVPLDDFDGQSELTQGFYCLEGYCVITINEKSVLLSKGEQLVTGKASCDEHKIISVMGSGTLIRMQIFKDGEKSESAVVNKAPVTFDDYIATVKLAYLYSQRSGKILGEHGEKWLDDDIKEGIRKAERFYAPFFLLIIGLVVVFFTVNQILGLREAIIGAIMWLVLDIAILTPLIYLRQLPIPINDHIKDLDQLTTFERMKMESEKEKNDMSEKILKKYKMTGKNQYDNFKRSNNKK